MYKIKINEIVKETVIDTNTEQLAVSFEIYTENEKEERTVIRTARHGFSIDTPKEEIIAELEKFASASQSDDENAVRNQELEAKHVIADDTINSLADKDLDVAKEEIESAKVD